MKAFGASAALSIGLTLGLQTPEGTGVLKGRVVDAVSGKPLRGVAIRASYQPRMPYTPGIDPRPPDRSARTGQDGAFEIAALVAGEYAVYGSAQIPGADYLQIAYGVLRPDGQSSNLTVADRANLSVILRAWPAASVTGRVLDERGRPLAGVDVRLLTPDTDRYFYAATNDIGVYRIGGLSPGRYGAFVPVSAENRTLKASPEARPAAGSSPIWFPYLVDRDRRTILYNHGVPLPPPTEEGHVNIFVSSYYGGTSASDASYFPLAAGEARDGIDITLRALRGRRVAGAATVASGSVAGVLVTLTPAGSMHPQHVGRLTATAAGDGTFVFVAAPEGAYTLTARRRGPPLTEVSIAGGAPAVAQDDYITGDPDGLGAEMPLTIGDADIDGLEVNLRPGTPIAGRATFANEPFDQRVMRLSPFLSPAGETPYGDGTRVLKVAADGSISGNARPGSYILRVQAPAGWSFTGALVGGRDVGDGPIAVGGDPIVDLELAFTRAATVVRGAADSAREPQMASTAVVVFPTDRATWPSLRMSDTLRAKTALARGGKYEISGVLPGEYYVVAVGENFSVSALTLSMLARLAEGASRVQLQPGQPVTLNLQVRSINP